MLKAREIIDKKQTSSVDKNRNIRFLIRFFHYVKIYHYIDFSEIEKMQPFRDDSIHRIKPKAKMVQFDEFKKIYAACNSDFYRLAFLTFYLFGLRLGELLGLTVEAFNFDDHIFEIFQEANFKTGSGGFIITTPKTNDSKRLYLMPETYEQIVIQHIKNYKLTSKDFIFFRARGKNIFRNEPRPEETFRRQANNYCRHIAPDFHFHMLRHSAVTYLHDKGVPLADISRFVGHGSINITEDVYLEKSQAKQKQIVSILEDTIKQLENSIKISIKK